MLMFLGKNWLKQSDKQDINLSGTVSSGYDLSSLSKLELLNLRELLVKAKTNGQFANNSGD